MVNHQLMTPLLEFPSNATESAITMIPELNVSVLYSRYHTMAHFYITSNLTCFTAYFVLPSQKACSMAMCKTNLTVHWTCTEFLNFHAF